MTYCAEEIMALLADSDHACMRAICAIFRNQTGYEKSCHATVNKNGVGFRANHAKAGTALALWMTCGNDDGVMRRRVGGMTTYNGEQIPRVILCREIARYYIEQLTNEANRIDELKKEAAMVRAHEEEEYGKYEREDSYYSRNSNDYQQYHTWPC